MKYYTITLFFLISLSIFSCKKEKLIKEENTQYYVYDDGSDDNDSTIVGDDNEYDIDYIPDSLLLGYEWTLIDARVYVENLDKGYKNVYKYFDNTNNTASMSLFDPSIVLMDEIEKGITNWYFSNDTFLLNKQYVFDFEKHYNPFNDLILRPYGLAGGTSRPITVVEADETHMKVSVRESNNSDNVYNYKYVSELIFERESVIPKIDTTFKDGYVYNGKWVYTDPDPSTVLTGTKWVIVRYNNGLSGNVYPNDTLDFISDTEYTINGGLPRSYTISNVVGNNMKSLSLYSLTTLGGDYSGQVMSTFITDGVINNTEFHDIFNVNNRVTTWITKI